MITYMYFIKIKEIYVRHDSSCPYFICRLARLLYEKPSRSCNSQNPIAILFDIITIKMHAFQASEYSLFSIEAALS